MTQDILTTRIETDMDPAYYAALLADCQQQLDASVRSEQRFAATLLAITEQRETLEQRMIEAWDNVEQFALLKAEYEGLQVVFNLAPKAHAHHEKRTNALRLHAIWIRSVRDKAMVAARYAAAEAKAEAERVERERVAEAERQQRIAERQAERDIELAEQHARNAAIYERVEADKQDSLSWLQRLTGTNSHE
jgi:septal ring factor EnvC (AmiA/AmiB activator)